MVSLTSVAAPYAGLHAYLKGRYADIVVLTFAEMEDALGFTLPDRASASTEWWSNDTDDNQSPQSRLGPRPAAGRRRSLRPHGRLRTRIELTSGAQRHESELISISTACSPRPRIRDRPLDGHPYAGAGLALWFAPRIAAGLRERVIDPARDLAQRVSDRYEQVSTRIVGAADEVTRKGQDVRDDVADAVAHGAHEVERFARATKTR